MTALLATVDEAQQWAAAVRSQYAPEPAAPLALIEDLVGRSPRPRLRARRLTGCAYCGAQNGGHLACFAHSDLPALDPHYNDRGARQTSAMAARPSDRKEA